MINKLILMGIATALGIASLTATGATIQSGDSVAFLGDSITELGWKQPTGFVRLCEVAFKTNGLEVTIIPAGVGGNASDQLLSRLQTDVLSKKPTVMTLSCGINDVWRFMWGDKDRLAKFKKNMTEIVARTQAAGVKVVILTATVMYEDADTPHNKYLADYNDFVRTLAKEKGCKLVDLNPAVQKLVVDLRAKNDGYSSADLEPDLRKKLEDSRLRAGERPVGGYKNFVTTDGVHLQPVGNRLVARMILKDGFGFTEEELVKSGFSAKEAE